MLKLPPVFGFWCWGGQSKTAKRTHKAANGHKSGVAADGQMCLLGCAPGFIPLALPGFESCTILVIIINFGGPLDCLMIDPATRTWFWYGVIYALRVLVTLSRRWALHRWKGKKSPLMVIDLHDDRILCFWQVPKKYRCVRLGGQCACFGQLLTHFGTGREDSSWKRSDRIWSTMEVFGAEPWYRCVWKTWISCVYRRDSMWYHVHVNLQGINEQRQPLAGNRLEGRSVWENFDLSTMSPQAMPGPRRWNSGHQTRWSRRHRRAIKNN